MLQLVSGCCHIFSGGADVSDMCLSVVWDRSVFGQTENDERAVWGRANQPMGASEVNGCLLFLVYVPNNRPDWRRGSSWQPCWLFQQQLGYLCSVVSELEICLLLSIVSLVISRLLLSVKLHLTLLLNLMFGHWQALLLHTSHISVNCTASNFPI